MKNMRKLIFGLLTLVGISTVSEIKSDNGFPGALGGGILGAGIGGAVGGGRGAAIGGVTGAFLGGAIGSRRGRYYNDGYYGSSYRRPYYNDYYESDYYPVTYNAYPSTYRTYRTSPYKNMRRNYQQPVVAEQETFYTSDQNTVPATPEVNVNIHQKEEMPANDHYNNNLEELEETDSASTAQETLYID